MGDKSFKDGDVSPGGSRIFDPSNAPIASDRSKPTPFIEEIEAHLNPFFGEATNVFHELVSPLIHLDVLIYPPKGDRKHWLYVTAGMSDLPMTVPDDLEAARFSRTELVIGLPHAWGARLAQGFDDEEVYAPIGLMKWLARYPHEVGTFFASGHSIPNAVNADTMTGQAPFSGVMLSHPTTWPEEAQAFELSNGQHLNFLGVYPIFEDEMELKLNKGTDVLYDAFDRHGVTEVFNIKRPSVLAARKKFWGLF
jgi:hypothetical protein